MPSSVTRKATRKTTALPYSPSLQTSPAPHLTQKFCLPRTPPRVSPARYFSAEPKPTLVPTPIVLGGNCEGTMQCPLVDSTQEIAHWGGDCRVSLFPLVPT